MFEIFCHLYWWLSSLWLYIYLMHEKYEVFINSQVYKNKVEDQLGRNIIFFRSDCGKEYMFDLFGNCLKQHSIIYQLGMPYTP